MEIVAIGANPGQSGEMGEHGAAMGAEPGAGQSETGREGSAGRETERVGGVWRVVPKAARRGEMNRAGERRSRQENLWRKMPEAVRKRARERLEEPARRAQKKQLDRLEASSDY